MAKWYSMLSTGFLELDSQHQNLDTLLSLITSSNEAQGLEYMRMFARGLSAHFRFEESFLLSDGGQFADAIHREDHQRMEEQVESGLAQMDADPSCIELHAMEFCSMLMSHATRYDIPSAKPVDRSPSLRQAD